MKKVLTMPKLLQNNLTHITFQENKIKELCVHAPIRRLSIFGSILRDDFCEESDVDLLVEFLPFVQVGYFELVDLENQLSDLLNRKVDLRTPHEISHYFRQQVINEAVILYVKN